MSEGINFTPKNLHANSARLVNSQLQANKAEAAVNVANTVQQNIVRNTSEFITQSAKEMYQFFANMQSAQLRNSELSLVLKDLLNMQKDLESFLANVTDKNLQNLLQQMTKPDLAKLLMNSQMDLSKLTQLMQQNGKEALSKLFNMTADYAQSGAVARSSQISEIIAILNACTPNSETSQAQVLKNMMLLYLPWLPVGEQNFSIQIGTNGGSEEDEKITEDSISILISTIHFGNVKVLIFKSDKSTINFNISAGESFPKEKILSELKAEAKEYNVQTSMEFEKKEVLEKKFTKNKTETQVSVNTGKHINPFLILMAQSTIRIIIETDKNITLVENRKEKI